MRDWGLLDQVLAKASLPQIMSYRSYRNGQVLNASPFSPVIENRFGSPHLVIHRKEILKILLEEARRLNVDLKTNSRVVDIDLSAVMVTTAGGEIMTADLIVAADGDHGFCRSKILGRAEVPQPEPTGTLVYRFTVDSDVLRRDPELGRLVNPPGIVCWIAPKSHVVMYELSYNGIVNVVVTAPDPVEGRIQLGPRPADPARLASAFADWDPLFLKLLKAAKSANYWTLLQLSKENRVWVDDKARRTLLVGDAAHAMTPYLYVQDQSRSVKISQDQSRSVPVWSASIETHQSIR